MRALGLIMVCLVLTACKGGNSNNDGHQPPSPVDAPLELNTDNATLVMTAALAFPESIQQVLTSGLRWVSRLAASTSTQIADLCGAGTLEIELGDADFDGRLSTGDTVTLRLDNCAEFSHSATQTGTLTVSLTDVVSLTSGEALYEGALDIPSGLSLDDGDTIKTLTGDFSFSYLGKSGEETITASGSHDQTLAVEVSGETDQLRDFTWSRSFNARTMRNYQVEFDGTLHSETLMGMFTCAGTGIEGQSFDTSPEVGQVRCSGAHSAVVRLSSDPQTEGTLSLDAEGDGTFVTLQSPQS